MKYFQPCQYTFPIPARTQGSFTIQGTYLGQKLGQEFANFYANYINLINAPQVQALNNPQFQRFDFKISASFKKHLNYFLRTQIKQKTLVEAHNASDKLFESFTPIASILQDNERLFSASLYWRRIFEFVDDWEKRNGYQLHKGTIFSFWSWAELLAGDSDIGFMLMRKGLAEDERYHNATTPNSPLTSPALDFIRLDIKTKNSYFRNIVKRMRRPITKRINKYNATFNYQLKLNIFRRQFSQVNSLEEASLYFNVTHLRITRLTQMFKLNLGGTDTARHTLISSLFELSKIAEVVARKSSAAQNNARRFTIRTFLINLASHYQWTINLRILGDEVDNKFNGTLQNIDNIVNELLQRNMPLATTMNFPPIVYDCLLLYGIRNYGAHSINNVPDVFSREYKEIVQRCYNALFFITENYQLI